MPSDTVAAGPARLFFFAHQDDEFAVFHQLELSIAAGYDVHCIYCTSGVPTGHPPLHRQRESLHVLQKLGVQPSQVFFAGQALGIADLQLMHRLDILVPWLVQYLQNHAQLDALYLPAWEGGHPDHDALHAALISACRRLSAAPPLWQFALYNGWQCRGGLFRLLHPLATNGPVVQQTIAVRDRWRYLGLCLAYRSQWKSWLGLGPALCWHYWRKGTQDLQQAKPDAPLLRPHPGPLYYEQRGFARWADMHRLTRDRCITSRTNIID